MDIIFTRHAKRRMKWRKISQEEVKSVITWPDKIERMPHKQRINAYKKVEKRLLKVSYILKGDQIMVITAIDKSK